MQKNSVTYNIVWSVVERLSSQIVYFVVSVVIARLIDPSEYGVVTTIAVIVNIFGGAIQSGFSSALIFMKEPERKHYSTAFWGTVLLCALFYGILFLSAPLVAKFYYNEKIVVYMRVMAIQLILQGIQSIPFAYVSKKMQFKKNYFATLLGVVVSAIVSLCLAYSGMVIWALIVLTSVEVLTSSIVLWISTGLRISLEFNIDIAKNMFRYCWKLMGVDVLNSAYSSINSIVIGKKYNQAEVAYYNRAYNLPQTLLGSVNTAVSKVLFPAFAQNGDKSSILYNLRKSIKTINYVLYPMLIGMFAVSEELILVLYTEKWAGTVPYLRLMCIVWMFQPIQICVIQAYKAIGKSDEYFKLELIKKALALVLLALAVLVGNNPIILAYALVVGQISSTMINFPSLKRIFGYDYLKQIIDICSALGIGLVMLLATTAVGLLFDRLIIRLIVRILTGVCVYILLSVATRNEQLRFFCNLVFQHNKKEI